MTARRSLVIAAVVTSLALSACSSGDGKPSASASRSSEDVTTVEVTSAGGTVAFGSFTISVPAGAVTSKTHLTVRPAGASPSPRAASVLKPLTGQVDVALDGGAEPAVPVTVTAKPSNPSAATAAETGSIMLLSQDGRTHEWNLTPARYDGASRLLSATVNHFSILGFIKVDVTAPLGAMLDVFKGAFELEGAPKPDCAGKPLKVGATTYSVDPRYQGDGDGIVWPCLAQGSNGKIELTLSNATGLPWLLRSKPQATVTDTGTVDINRAVLLALYHQYLSGGRFSQSMVLPGAVNKYAFDAAKLPGFVDMEIDGFAQQSMALIWALRFALDLFYPEAAVLHALSDADFGSCVSDLFATATGTFTAKTVGSFTKAFFSCAGNVVKALGGSIVGVAKVVVAAMSGGISLILNDLISAYRTLAGKAYARVSVSVKRPASFAGSWQGPVAQPGSRPYSTLVKLAEVAGRWSANVTYPELGCSGSWEQVSRSPSTVELIERITADPADTCVKTVDIAITLASDGQLVVDYWNQFQAHLSRRAAP